MKIPTECPWAGLATVAAIVFLTSPAWGQAPATQVERWGRFETVV